MPGRIPPSTWGPFFWHTMHIVALGYPTNPSYAEKRAAKEFYESFAQLIPCPTCKHHYAENLKEMPLSPSLDSKQDLFKWTVDMHNKVNKQLGKPEVSELEAISFYHKLGDMGRSPVWTPEDIESLYLSKGFKYSAIGLGTIAIIGGAVYYFISKE